MRKVVPFTVNVEIKVEVRAGMGGKALAEFERTVDLLGAWHSKKGAPWAWSLIIISCVYPVTYAHG
ncbi:MAG: hypothetical protein ACREKK_10265 [Candidatus Methylomirabilales bacterium]